MRLPQLRRVRWAVRTTLTLGVAASVTANVLHAQQNPISQAIAAWPPLALLLTVELISRVPVDRRSLAFGRFIATAIIAGIAAWVSYWHMAGVASRYGETGASPYLLPMSVDGLIIVASICLVELGGRIGAAETVQAEAVTPAPAPVHVTSMQPAIAPAPAAPGLGAAMPQRQSTMDTPTKRAAPRAKPASSTDTPRQRRPPAETAALAAAIEAVHPEVTEADLARQLGISTSRLRTV
ncbi:MAG TPA: DUF2637 domain-containing protein, partial [Micromonosporaceae bacterium]|nr:DUF2637 domain-containing protein [Micromonosporaceae bacterium]